MESKKNILEKYENEFEVFYSLLSEYNERFNLTAITDREEVYVKHFEDSLSACGYLGRTVLDVGSGAGFPGIPLAIANPDKEFTLIDSLKKRVEFLQTVINGCGLKNVKVLHSRAEDMDKKSKFETVTSRAVAPLNILCEYCLPFVKTCGIMIAYKGKKADEEITAAENAIKILGGEIEKKAEYKLKEKDGESDRSLIIIKKVTETESKYPRGGNKPRIKPL